MSAFSSMVGTTCLDGAIGALAVLSVLVAIVLRDRLYAVYAGVLAAYLGYQIVEPAYLAHAGIARVAGGVAYLIALGLGAAFAREFLDLPADGKRTRLLGVLVGLVGIAVGLVVFSDPGPVVSGPVAGLVPLTAALLLAYQLALGFEVQNNGSAPARWYGIGCAGLVVGLVTHASAIYGVIPPSEFVALAGGAGVAWQAIFLSLALADRVRDLSVRTSTLEAIAYHDALTGLANRRALDLRLAEEWRRGSRAGSRLALIMIDVDHFKRYNDTFGHQRGDTVLRAVGSALESVARRDDDLVARYGGEELVVVLPGARRAQAASVADKLRAAVRALAIPHPCSSHGVVTVSCGVAVTVPRHGRDSSRLIAAADRALYRAKAQGRDRTEIALPRRSPPAGPG